MRVFRVPIQLDREEKVFGGSLSLRKLIYLVVCVGLGSFFFMALYRVSLEAAALVWGLFSVCGWFTAYFKVRKEYNVDEYAVMFVRHLTVKKDWPFFGGHL